ncbi:transcriptional regulator, GntR family [Thermaerobacter marianensis DSM 12885]|uniref:Transcriptional regulator, GntR family n=1 Tax=Thermaerobacter marianensis (strain ATCC 700841 / DSM 12885 / JCM 10246 / 7p75a) TaxID=644966 RepID=E6SHE2_THEM7|nr:GntR family transcriptional regulator [Thermaerobacter marianensis]ADU50706.1 transcriptional regulator, GntR family [Thermaerobacter marianensis DSM 12885]
MAAQGGNRPTLYLEIMEELRRQIREGRLRPGDRIPSERELAAQFGASRMTVRHALNQLAWDGIIVRRQGRGSFVAEPKIPLGLQFLTSFSEDMRRRGLTPSSRLLGVGVTEADPATAEALGLLVDRRVTALRRVRYADDRPLSVEYVQVPYRLLPALADHVRQVFKGKSRSDFSLYAFFARAGIGLERARQTVEATVATPDLARLLQVAEGAPLLLLTRVSYDGSGRAVEMVRAWYRGDRYRYETELVRPPAVDPTGAAPAAVGWEAPVQTQGRQG